MALKVQSKSDILDTKVSTSGNCSVSTLQNNPGGLFFEQLKDGSREYRDLEIEQKEKEKRISNKKFAETLSKNPNATVTTLQVGEGAKKIKGYYATNPETGETVYADEDGREYTYMAFRNWEQFAKDGTFIY